MKIAVAIALRSVLGGASEPSPLRFDYAAAPECPIEADFLERVAMRTEKLRLAEPGQLARTFMVRIAVSATGAVGRIEFLDVLSDPIVRRVQGASCDEVTTGLALITALAIEGRLPEPPEQAETLRETPPSPADFVPSKPSPVAFERRFERKPPSSRPGAPSAGWGLGVVGGIDSMLGLGVTTALGVNVELVSLRSSRALRVGFEKTQGNAALGPRAADFAWTTGSVVACPGWFPRRGVVAIWPCVGLEAGGLDGAGQRSSELPIARQNTLFWAAAQVSARLRLIAVDGLFMDLGGDLSFPLIRHDFTFEVPHRVVFRVPAAIAGAQVAAGLRFW